MLYVGFAERFEDIYTMNNNIYSKISDATCDSNLLDDTNSEFGSLQKQTYV
jgi:hypothetical protein